jgi:hypothetical protein
MLSQRRKRLLRTCQLDRRRTTKLRTRPRNIPTSMACRHFDRWDASRPASMSLQHKGRGIRTRQAKMLTQPDNLCIELHPRRKRLLRTCQLDRRRTTKLRTRPRNIPTSMACRHFDRWEASRPASMSLEHKRCGIRTHWHRAKMLTQLDNRCIDSHPRLPNVTRNCMKPRTRNT